MADPEKTWSTRTSTATAAAPVLAPAHGVRVTRKRKNRGAEDHETTRAVAEPSSVAAGPAKELAAPPRRSWPLFLYKPPNDALWCVVNDPSHAYPYLQEFRTSLLDTQKQAGHVLPMEAVVVGHKVPEDPACISRKCAAPGIEEMVTDYGFHTAAPCGFGDMVERAMGRELRTMGITSLAGLDRCFESYPFFAEPAEGHFRISKTLASAPLTFLGFVKAERNGRLSNVNYANETERDGPTTYNYGFWRNHMNSCNRSPSTAARWIDVALIVPKEVLTTHQWVRHLGSQDRLTEAGMQATSPQQIYAAKLRLWDAYADILVKYMQCPMVLEARFFGLEPMFLFHNVLPQTHREKKGFFLGSVDAGARTQICLVGFRGQHVSGAVYYLWVKPRTADEVGFALIH